MKTLVLLIALMTIHFTLRGEPATPESLPPSPVPAEPTHFTVEQLEGMADRGEWNNVVLHLADVVPTQRNSRWEAVVERGAVGYLGTLAGQGNVAERMSDSLLTKFPSLANSTRYHRARLDSWLTGLEACYQRTADEPGCRERYLKFAAGNPRETDWLRRAAEIISHRAGAVAAMPYYRGWIEGDRHGAAVCDRPAVRRATLEALASAPAARDLTLGICWQAMRGELGKALRRSPASATRSAICAILHDKNLSDEACRSKR